MTPVLIVTSSGEAISAVAVLVSERFVKLSAPIAVTIDADLLVGFEGAGFEFVICACVVNRQLLQVIGVESVVLHGGSSKRVAH